MAEGLRGLRIYQLAEDLSDEIWAEVSTWKPFARDTVGRQLVEAADSIGGEYRGRLRSLSLQGQSAVPVLRTRLPRRNGSLASPRHPTQTHLRSTVQRSHAKSSRSGTAITQQREILATRSLALLRSRGRPSPSHKARRKCSALPAGPTERGGPPPLLGLSPGLCGPGRTVAYFMHRTVNPGGTCDALDGPALGAGDGDG
jgi:hypothetical protein